MQFHIVFLLEKVAISCHRNRSRIKYKFCINLFKNKNQISTCHGYFARVRPVPLNLLVPLTAVARVVLARVRLAPAVFSARERRARISLDCCVKNNLFIYFILDLVRTVLEFFFIDHWSPSIAMWRMTSLLFLYTWFSKNNTSVFFFHRALISLDCCVEND